MVQCFANCPDEENTSNIIELCKRIVRRLLEKEVLLKEMPVPLSNVKLEGEDAQPFPDDYVVNGYLMLKFVKENLIRVQQTLESIGARGRF